ncbi:FAD-binding oxidoreductase [Roseomonas sp. SSH11]|uniref:FAD-binding oxidoreductase n=1 Tax=Pararoseomonas baculiformis TaxID=2820812 RepID=A0ABS4AAH6_9PROT|nr:FAD-binding oxidoreductase [Pararoseomonas baculiformis]MBP0443861.1 FAD-binding oxidoreductase [Pararoseomonas baculiformis]
MPAETGPPAAFGSAPPGAHLVVIGAGILGATTALAALDRGFRVTILDPGPPGGEQAASYGNGCWLSVMSVIPPAVPGLWKQVPAFLRDPLGPLAIRWSYLPRVLPWLWAYLRSGWTEARVLETARALRTLLADAPALHKALAERAGVGDLIRRDGLVYVYPSRAEFEREAMGFRIRRQVGLNWTEIGPEEMRQIQPELDPRYGFGALFEEAGHCTDPGAYVAALVEQAVSEGAILRRTAATGFRIEAGRLKSVRTGEGEIAADRAVIAAGARSKHLAAAAGSRVPLETERGYHAVVLDAEVGPRIPIMPSDGKMGITPTRAGLRASGQVEIAGLEAAPNWRRAEILLDHLLRAFPKLPRDLPPERIAVWMGHRPSMPDGLPCLGVSAATPDVVLAFGHGHVGLVAAPRSALAAAALAAGVKPEIDLGPYDPRRFG